MQPLAEVVIDHDAIAANVAELRRYVAPARLMVVVKADGYGHGMVPVAATARAAGADWIGVATLGEAETLREAGDSGPLLCWLALPGADWSRALRRDIEVTAYDTEQLREIAAAATAAGTRARVQLKVDTGLGRGGAALANWPELCAAARTAELGGSVTITGVWSHFATSDEPEHPAGDRQERSFTDALAVARAAGLTPESTHLANSAGALLRPSARYDLVRVGLATYGLDPAPGHLPADLVLRPAMTVRTRLALVKDLAAGEGVSYGHTFVADRPMTVGLVPIGYGDGVIRAAGNSAEVAVNGARARILGRVCMDQFVVDVTGLNAHKGDEVVLFGPGEGNPSAQEWAEAVGTISYEIVTRIGSTRVPRRPAVPPLSSPADG